MILTEKEASTKRCQESFGPVFTSPHGTALTVVGGNVTVSSPTNCIGSSCMAWRWYEYNTDKNNGNRLDGKTGYCGKAGRGSF